MNRPARPCVECQTTDGWIPADQQRPARSLGLCRACYQRRRRALLKGELARPIGGFETAAEEDWPFASMEEYESAIRQVRGG